MMTRKLAESRIILVRCPNWVGDIVMATPAFDCLRENFAKAKIIAVLKRNARGIVKDGPWFDGLIDCEDKSLSGLRRMRAEIRQWKPDVAIVFPNSIRSALTVRLSGVREIYGYRRNFRGFLLSGGPKPIRSGHQVLPIPTTEYYLGICRWLGLKIPDQIKPRLFIGEKVRRHADSLIQKYGIRNQDLVIGFNPGASFGSSKRWPSEYFAELAGFCQDNLGARILLFGGPGEEDIARDIVRRSHANIINTVPDQVDLELLKPLIQRCNLLVTNDTGPRHYAVALDVPVVVIMGPIDPRLTDSNLERTIIIRKNLDCSPCHKKVCPREHECMRQITPKEVFAAVEDLLKTNRQYGPFSISKKMA